MFRLLALAVPLTALTFAAPAVGADHDDHYMNCAKACDDCGRICDACGGHCAKLLAEGQKGTPQDASDVPGLFDRVQGRVLYRGSKRAVQRPHLYGLRRNL